MVNVYNKLIMGALLTIIGVLILAIMGGALEINAVGVIFIWFGISILILSTKFAQIITENRGYRVIFGVILILFGIALMILTGDNLKTGIFAWFGFIAFLSGVAIIITCGQYKTRT